MVSDRIWAIITSDFINAYSIVASLKALGWCGPIVCLKEKKKGWTLVEASGMDVIGLPIDLNIPEDLPDVLSKHIPASEPKVVFFCDERFHHVFMNKQIRNKEHFRVMIGSVTQLDAILDKFTFYNFIQDRNLAEIPRTITSQEDPSKRLGYPFFIRFKKSWDGVNLLPRVQIITRPEQQRKVEDTYAQMGLLPHQWCYQEALSIDPRHNVSISGWHGPDERLYFATRHLLRHPSANGNGDVTEIIAPPKGLLECTERILSALEYQGPFELEFVLDLKCGSYKVIELNPRFWMQHGLIEAVTGHALVSKYADVIGTKCINRSGEIRYWVNTLYAIYRIAKGDLRVLKYLFNSKALLVPPLSIALKSCIPFGVKKIKALAGF